MQDIGPNDNDVGPRLAVRKPSARPLHVAALCSSCTLCSTTQCRWETRPLNLFRTLRRDEAILEGVMLCSHGATTLPKMVIILPRSFIVYSAIARSSVACQLFGDGSQSIPAGRAQWTGKNVNFYGSCRTGILTANGPAVVNMPSWGMILEPKLGLVS